jgi:pimeloyl-ACP methyl ester carboxylesterase
MDLWYRDLGGDGGPVVILHGLFGSSQNWAGMGRKLSSEGHVYGLDLRNHGESAHAPTHTLADCVQDLADWSDAHVPGPLRLIGHSMGGLVAMGFALRHPDRAAGVAAIDIAPRPYPPEHGEELAALKTDIRACRSRAEVEALLLPILPDVRTRQFIMTNAARDGDGFRWRLNVAALERREVAADWGAASGRFDGEALLVAGGRSEYVRPEDHELMRRFFPRARIEILPAADHWPHVTAPGALEDVLRGFLKRAAISG